MLIPNLISIVNGRVQTVELTSRRSPYRTRSCLRKIWILDSLPYESVSIEASFSFRRHLLNDFLHLVVVTFISLSLSDAPLGDILYWLFLLYQHNGPLNCSYLAATTISPFGTLLLERRRIFRWKLHTVHDPH